MMAAPANYALSCGRLLLPTVAWNIALAKRLPQVFQRDEFWRDIPAPLAVTENGLRIAVFVVPFLMPLDITAPGAVRALFIFGAGTLHYFASWLALIWLFGIALLGDRLFWGTFYRWWMYLALCLAFLAAHITHTMRVHARNRQRGAA